MATSGSTKSKRGKPLAFLHSDGGRAATGRPVTNADCVIRALTHLLWSDVDSLPRLYSRCHAALAEASGDRDVDSQGVLTDALTKVYQACGLKRVPLRRGKRPSLDQVYREHGNCIVLSTTGSRHALCIRGGAVWDTVDERDRTAQAVWIKA